MDDDTGACLDVSRLERALARLNIVVPLIGPIDDPDLVSERALPVARALVHDLDASVVLVSVVEKPFSVGALTSALSYTHDREDSWLTDLRQYLEEVASTFPDGNVQTVLRSGPPVDEIEAETRNLERALVVMASHGRIGMERMLLGSVAYRLVHRVDCPVVLVREILPGAYRLNNLLVPLDGSPTAEAGLERALDLLGDLPLRLHLLHVVEPLTDYYGFVARGYRQAAISWAEGYLDETSGRLSLRGYEATTEVRHGHAVEQIARVAIERRVDMIALSTYGRRVPRRMLFGLTTERMLHEAELPLLVVRPDADPGALK